MYFALNVLFWLVMLVLNTDCDTYSVALSFSITALAIDISLHSFMRKIELDRDICTKVTGPCHTTNLQLRNLYFTIFGAIYYYIRIYAYAVILFIYGVLILYIADVFLSSSLLLQITYIRKIVNINTLVSSFPFIWLHLIIFSTGLISLALLIYFFVLPQSMVAGSTASCTKDHRGKNEKWISFERIIISLKSVICINTLLYVFYAFFINVRILKRTV